MYIVKKKETPIWEKKVLTIEEASAYSSISMNALYKLTSKRNSKIGEWYGSKLMVSREKLEKFIEETKYIE